MDIANRLPAALPASAWPAGHRPHAHAPASESRAGTAPRTTPPADATRTDLDRYAALAKSARSHGSAQPVSPGYQTLVERLYEGHEPPVRSFHADGIDHHPYHYLTRADRSFLGEVYAFAQAEGADLQHVDQLADAMSIYRRMDDGRILANANRGNSFDGEGRLLTYDFNDEDAAAAARIRNGTAIHSTRLDRGFLNHLLDPGYSALSNTSKLAFVEKVVQRFSREGASTSLGKDFTRYEFPDDGIISNIRTTVHEDIRADISPELLRRGRILMDLTSATGSTSIFMSHEDLAPQTATDKLRKPTAQSIRSSIDSQLIAAMYQVERPADRHVDELLRAHGAGVDGTTSISTAAGMGTDTSSRNIRTGAGSMHMGAFRSTGKTNKSGHE